MVITTESESDAASEPLNDLTISQCGVHKRAQRPEETAQSFVTVRAVISADKFYTSTGTVSFFPFFYVQTSKAAVIVKVSFLQCKTTDCRI